MRRDHEAEVGCGQLLDVFSRHVLLLWRWFGHHSLISAKCHPVPLLRSGAGDTEVGAEALQPSQCGGARGRPTSSKLQLVAEAGPDSSTARSKPRPGHACGPRLSAQVAAVGSEVEQGILY